jgi:hypothetical protein
MGTAVSSSDPRDDALPAGCQDGPPTPVTASLPEALAVLELSIRLDWTIEDLVQRLHRVLGAEVGVVGGGREVVAGVAPLVPPGPCPGARTRSLSTGETVWVGRPLGRETAEVVLEQLAVAARTALLRHAADTPEHEQVAALVSAGADERRRSALRRLGVPAEWPVRVLAVTGPSDGVRSLVAGERRHGRVLTARTGPVAVVVVADRPDVLELDVPVGLRIGMSAVRPIAAAAQGWSEALLAVRFCQPSPRPRGPYRMEESVILDVAEVASLALFAGELPPDRIAEVADVQALERLVAAEGPELLRTLDAVVSTSSMRKAAERIQIHHNSVTQRVARVERGLGFSIDEPYGRTRLFIAVMLRRLWESSAAVAGAGDRWSALDTSG